MSQKIVGNKAKERISNGGNKKAKHAKYSEKRIPLTPWYAHVRAYQGVRNVCSSENLACFAFF